MKRVTKRVPLTGGQARYITTVSSDSAESDYEKRFRLQEILRILADTPDLWNCGPALFSTLKMRFTGECWVIEMEAQAEDVGK